MPRGYYYDFVGHISNDPSLTPEQIAELEKYVEVRDPLNGNKVVEGVIAFDAQNGNLSKYKIFRGEKLRGVNGMLEVEYMSRRPPTPQFEAVKIKPKPPDPPKSVEEKPKSDPVEQVAEEPKPVEG